MTGSAKWLPVSMPTGVSRCEIQKKKREEEEKVAVEKQMRDRNPLLTAVSPGRGTSIHCDTAALFGYAFTLFFFFFFGIF